MRIIVQTTQYKKLVVMSRVIERSVYECTNFFCNSFLKSKIQNYDGGNSAKAIILIIIIEAMTHRLI